MFHFGIRKSKVANYTDKKAIFVPDYRIVFFTIIWVGKVEQNTIQVFGELRIN